MRSRASSMGAARGDWGDRAAVAGTAMVLCLGLLSTVPAVAIAGTSARTQGQGATALSPTGPHLPSTGALFGAYVAVIGDHTGDDQETATLFLEGQLGRKLAVDKQGYAWSDPWPTDEAAWSRDQGRTLFFDWNTKEWDQTIIPWAGIAAGQYDALLDAKAQAIKAFGAPAFFQFEHEPETDTGIAGTTDDYVDAYRHIHDRFEADGVTNLSYVLTLLATSFGNGNADLYYPGDGYVDLLAADGYNWFECPGRNDPWESFQDAFLDFYDYGLAKGKPMIVSEWGSNEDDAIPGRKGQWITDAAATLKSWPEIKVVSYYDNGPPAPICDWWADSSQESLDALAAMGADPYFNPPPPLVTISSGPSDPDAHVQATFGFSANVPNSQFTCSLDGGSGAACSSPHTFSGLSQGDHSATITATDPISGESGSTLWSWSVDSIAPTITIPSAPPPYTSNTSATFNLVSNEPVPPGWFTCQVDASAAEECGSWTTYDNMADGAHTFTGIAYDEAGNASSPEVRTWTVDTVPPVATITSGPPSLTNSKSATFTFTGSEQGTTFKCARDGGSASSCTSPKTYNNLSDGPHSVSVTPFDQAGNTSAPATWAWRVDATKPVVTITSQPANPSKSSTASFIFTVTDGLPVTTTCQLDSGPAVPCGAGTQGGYANDAFGRTLTDTWGTSDSGNLWTYTSGAQADFDVNGSAGTVNLPTVNSPRTAYLSSLWTDQETVARFSVNKMPTNNRVNAYVLGRYDPASSGPFYTIRAGLLPTGTMMIASTKRATGGVEAQISTEVNLGAIGAANTWYWVRGRFVNEGEGVRVQGKVWKDGTPEPSTWQFSYLDLSSPILAAGRAGLRASPSATNAPFVLSWDDVTSLAGTTYSGLSDGSHTMLITSTDGAGNVGTATYTWTVDTVLPVATINSGPSNPSNSTAATFTFASNEPGSTFKCALDAGATTSCTSPFTYSGLSNGSHTFRLTATDRAGNASAVATWTWTVDTVSPTATITSGPSSLTNLKSATFTFTSNEPGSTFKCALDTGSFVSCASPKTLTGLADGPHTYKVEAIDPAGNIGAPVSWSWTVDATKPSTTITSGPSNPTSSSTATFTFTASEQGVTFTCQLDTGSPSTCTSGVTYTGIAIGNHTFFLFATDQAGNVGPTTQWRWQRNS